MNTGTKFMAAGATAGAVAAGVPVVIGLVRSMIPKPLDENDILRTENGCFRAQNGNLIHLQGINLNDELFWFKKDGMADGAPNYDIFDAFEERFGRYGARKLTQTFNENLVTAADLKAVKKLGANCVRIPLRYRNLFKKENCKGEIDFDYLDGVVAACRKAGLYVIFDLHSAPGFQNNGSACGSNGNCILFDSSKAAFDSRNAVIKLWTQFAAHYKDEPAIAAFDLLNRPLNKVADWEEKTDALNKFYLRLYKAIRTVDEKRIMIMQSPHSVENLPVFEKPLENIAYGLYSHFSTTYETDSLVDKIKGIGNKNIPMVICKLRTDENADYTLSALCNSGVSWVFGDYKGPAGASYLYTGNPEPADFDTDNFNAITEKWSKPLSTKNFELNKELSSTLKSHFGCGNVYVADTESDVSKKDKLKIKVKFGSSLVFGSKSTASARKLKGKA
ncbi:MAG: cellulase family glycosylhydrolase [Clostridia bacterium]|nr:cellulase family glycosylhydrolase [Clostridia bacterium]